MFRLLTFLYLHAFLNSPRRTAQPAAAELHVAHRVGPAAHLPHARYSIYTLSHFYCFHASLCAYVLLHCPTSSRPRFRILDNTCSFDTTTNFESHNLTRLPIVLLSYRARTAPPRPAGFFHDGGPMHTGLERVLMCYVCYRPDVGYVQVRCDVYMSWILLLFKCLDLRTASIDLT